MTQSPSLAQAQAAVAVLVERFARNLEQHRRAEYNEADVRHEFIEPFFEALGWDVHNVRGCHQRIGSTNKRIAHSGRPRVLCAADRGHGQGD